MSLTLEQFNSLPSTEATTELLRCCGSHKWSEQMLELRPFENLSQLQKSAEQIWQSLTKTDWLEAFSHHPRIGGVATSTWASQEQKGAAGASEEILRKLADGNTAYEKRFGHIFLVCATGKSAGEMLQLLEQRLGNAPEPELRIAVGEQAKITRIRLEKLFS